VSGRAVKVEVIFLDILTVIPLTVSESEQALFQNWIDPIPKRESETKDLFFIADPSDSVFAPSVCPRPCMIMREVIPRVAVLTVILPDRPPLPLRKIRPPFSPGHTLLGFLKSHSFACHLYLLGDADHGQPEDEIALLLIQNLSVCGPVFLWSWKIRN
jgi:hypothetical protein